MKKKALIITMVVLVLSIVSYSIFMVISNKKNMYDFKNNSYIFETIDDLDFLNEYSINDNISDNNIGKLTYTESKTITIKYKGDKFNIYAYDFKNKEDCVSYAEKVSGNNYSEIDEINKEKYIIKYYYKHTSFFNMFHTHKLLVFKDDKAYVITSKVSLKDFNKFIKFFMNQLPTKI